MPEIRSRTGQVIPVDGSRDFRYIIFIQKIFRKQDVVTIRMRQVLYLHRVRVKLISLNSLLYEQVIIHLRRVRKAKIMPLIL